MGGGGQAGSPTYSLCPSEPLFFLTRFLNARVLIVQLIFSSRDMIGPALQFESLISGSLKRDCRSGGTCYTHAHSKPDMTAGPSQADRRLIQTLRFSIIKRIQCLFVCVCLSAHGLVLSLQSILLLYKHYNIITGH